MKNSGLNGSGKQCSSLQYKSNYDSKKFILQTPGCVPLFGQVTALEQIRKAAQIEEDTSLLPFVVVTKIKNLYFAEP